MWWLRSRWRIATMFVAVVVWFFVVDRAELYFLGKNPLTQLVEELYVNLVEELYVHVEFKRYTYFNKPEILYYHEPTEIKLVLTPRPLSASALAYTFKTLEGETVSKEIRVGRYVYAELSAPCGARRLDAPAAAERLLRREGMGREAHAHGANRIERLDRTHGPRLRARALKRVPKSKGNREQP